MSPPSASPLTPLRLPSALSLRRQASHPTPQSLFSERPQGFTSESYMISRPLARTSCVSCRSRAAWSG
eukprot:12414687-Karenia_brevis.AAC.1